MEIRIHPVVKKYRSLCKICPKANKHNLKNGKPFVCLIADSDKNTNGPNGFRFNLDWDGNFVERNVH